MGNTCFMNSTLQCLAHTPPLRNYFLSGSYKSDLNVDNPLGTGGELANEFASLLGEMWTTKVAVNDDDEGGEERKDDGTTNGSDGIMSSSRTYGWGNGGSYHPPNTSSLSSSFTSPAATYPRSFKSTLGKHASQFVGYDQHDSQELAIYLLDALHEVCLLLWCSLYNLMTVVVCS